MNDSELIGLVRTEAYGLLAYEAIRAAQGLPLFAVSLYPDGTVWAEPPDEASGEDVVGFFQPSYDNQAAVAEAIQHEAIQRGFRAKPGGLGCFKKSARRRKAQRRARMRLTFGGEPT